VATIRVEAVYRPLGRGALASDLRSGRATVPNRNAQQAAEIADIVDAEESLPSEVVATGSIQRNGATQPLTPSRTQNVIDTDVSRYFIAATPGAVAVGAPGTRRDVNLSSATALVLQALTGISNADADLIVGARPASGFADRDDFRARLGDRGDALVTSPDEHSQCPHRLQIAGLPCRPIWRRGARATRKQRGRGSESIRHRARRVDRTRRSYRVSNEPQINRRSSL